MKSIKTFEEFLNENNQNFIDAYNKIDGLPDGYFKGAKRIDGIFKVSRYTWNEHNEKLKNNRKIISNVYVNLDEIHITQLFIEAIKTKDILSNLKKIPTITIFELINGEKIIYDGHHRLVAHWALGEKKIKVNITKLINENI